MLAVDLFCGVGGLSAGFREAGWSIAAANDMDARALETYALNFPKAKVFCQPIEEISGSEVLAGLGISRGDVDCLLGGPPCQAFSINNHNRSAEDYRASLVSHYLRLVEAINPKHLLIENVPGMLTVSGTKPLKAIAAALERAGYKSASALVTGSDIGLPQARKRLFVLASRVVEPRLIWRNMFGEKAKIAVCEAGVEAWRPTRRTLVSVLDALSDLPVLHNGSGSFEIEYSSRQPMSRFQARARDNSERLYNHACAKLGSKNLERLRFIGAGQNWRAIPENLLPSGMRRARKSDHTKRYGRLHWSGFASTILTKCDPHWGAYFHPDQDRVISVREAARLQGFRDDFVFFDHGITAQYRGIGNAVPPLVAAKIGKALKEAHRAQCHT